MRSFRLARWDLNLREWTVQMPVDDFSSISSFGASAAENDFVLKCFHRTSAIDRLSSGRFTLALGRKGSGKTALSLWFAAKDVYARRISLREYPWQGHLDKADRGLAPIASCLAVWRFLLAAESASLVTGNAIRKGKTHSNLKRFLDRNAFGNAVTIKNLAESSRWHVSNLRFEPSFKGLKGGFIDFTRQPLPSGTDLTAAAQSILDASLEVMDAETQASITIHLDDLDDVINPMTFGVKNPFHHVVIGLILAAEWVARRTEQRITPVVYLRNDTWDELVFSEKNKIHQDMALELSWDASDLFDLMSERTERLGSVGMWERIWVDNKWDLSRSDLQSHAWAKCLQILNSTVYRPRDVIQLGNYALGFARMHATPNMPLTLNIGDFRGAMTEYAKYLTAEFNDEIKPYWLAWEDLALESCAAVCDDDGTFLHADFCTEYRRRKGRFAQDCPECDDALHLMWRFSVIGYEDSFRAWIFKYRQPTAQWNPTAQKLQVHPGLRERVRPSPQRSPRSWKGTLAPRAR